MIIKHILCKYIYTKLGVFIFNKIFKTILIAISKKVEVCFIIYIQNINVVSKLKTYTDDKRYINSFYFCLLKGDNNNDSFIFYYYL